MKKFLLFVGTVIVGIGVANAAVRDASSINRQSAHQSTSNASTRNSARSATTTRTGNITTRAVSARNTTQRNTTTARTAKTTVKSITARSATPSQNTRASARNAISGAAVSVYRAASTQARAATTTNTFGSGYNVCRDAYFTCMDQFCAKQNETYRRCVCSERLKNIQSRERQLAQTSDQLQDFQNLNIDVIPKTGAEVKAMLNATDGEKIAANSRDRSDSAQKLAGISEVLSSTKSKALSTQGTLDIAGDINSIWATTDLASGAQIANLTGDALYNAVHSQCVDLISDKCSSTATLNMVVSAYGMYIENDCTALSTALDKKYTTANAAIRQAESQMHAARLENYDAHNSTAINECIAQVRKDITAESACGTNYVHCLDISGKYLNRDTGAPIYTADFYQLESSISLSGDVLNNQANRMLVNELNRKRTFAERGLKTCQDLADDVWEEFMRQAITEIYQGQQERIRQVKNECLDVVNKCYDAQSKSLKDFSNIKEQQLLGSRLELSEEMCQEKLYACANLYGGGSKGMDELVNAMGKITDQQIAKQCQATLTEYVKELCSVPSKDTLHSYPFGCRTYTPGSQYYAEMCHASDIFTTKDNDQTKKPAFAPSSGDNETPSGEYSCPTLKQYTRCEPGYYMAASATDTTYNGTPKVGNACLPCSALIGNCTCPGDRSQPVCEGECGDYDGSLYQKLVRYAQQTCVRPSQSSAQLPSNILQDVNVVMDSIRVTMAQELSKECERMGGTWINEPIKTPNEKQTHKMFYIETSANTKWGYCAQTEEAEDTTNTQKCPDGQTWNETTGKCEVTQSE